PRRDECGAALEHHDGPGAADDPQGHDGGCSRGGPHFLDADGRRRRAAAALHRGQRQVREEPGRVVSVSLRRSLYARFSKVVWRLGDESGVTSYPWPPRTFPDAVASKRPIPL